MGLRGKGGGAFPTDVPNINVGNMGEQGEGTVWTAV